MIKRVQIHRHGIRINVYQQFQTVFFHGLITKLDHFAEFPGGIHMQQRKWQRARIEGFTRQMQHDRGVFPDGVEHYRILKLGRHFTDDMDAFCFQLLQMG